MITKLGKLLLVIIACVFIAACSRITEENFNKIKTQMTYQEVINILGTPTNSESINIGGLSGTSASWKDGNGQIDIQFLNEKVVVKSYSKPNEETKPKNTVSV